MFEAADIREWRGHDVDDGGHKIGTLESVYVDTSSDQPAFATATVGLPTRHRLVVVPLNAATVGPGYLKVNHSRPGQVLAVDRHRRGTAGGGRGSRLQALQPRQAARASGERRLARR